MIFKNLHNVLIPVGIGLCMVLFALVVWLLKEPAPWENKTQCELAQWSYEYARGEAGVNDLETFLENGLSLFGDTSSNEFRIGYVRIISGELNAIMNYFSYNPFTGGVLIKRLDASVESIKENAVSVDVCKEN